MSDIRPFALGPVVANRFAEEHKASHKLHLINRLVERSVRATPLGPVVTDANGKMAFVPNYLQPVATQAPTDCPDPMTAPLLVGDRVEQVRSDFVNYGCFAVVDRIEGGLAYLKWEANPGGDNGTWRISTHRRAFKIVERRVAASFDPLTEPLRIGDEVEVIPWAKDNPHKRTKVVGLHADGTVSVDTGDGRSACGVRRCFRLIGKHG